MRRAEFAMSKAEAVGFLREATAFHLAGVAAGQPVLKTLHGVVVDDWLCFHAAPKGEKTSLLGSPVVAAAEEEVCRLASYAFDAEKACPATTLFRSVQVHGVLEELVDPALKARALQGLMEKLQPEGWHLPITADSALYAPQLRGLLVGGVRLEQVEGKAKLLQNKGVPDVDRALAFLWQRGATGDAKAIELVRAANPGSSLEVLRGPPEVQLHAWLPAGRVDEAVALLASEYWNEVFSAEDLRRAHLGSSAWVGATDAQGRLVATARALADGGKYAWVYDVAVAAPLRRRGVGQALLRLLLDHPAVRACRRVLLATRDAQGLYAKYGFVDKAAAPRRPFTSTEMVLLR